MLAAQVQQKQVWGNPSDFFHFDFDTNFLDQLPDTKESHVAFTLEDIPNLTSVPWLPSPNPFLQGSDTMFGHSPSS